jgi:hypothetical protein
MSTTPRPTLLVSALALALVGCTPLGPPPVAKSPLLPVRMSPDSVALDLFFVRCRFNDAKLNRTLWANVDETPFPAEVRLAWMRNGFRVGIMANEIPAEIAELLELNNLAAPQPGQGGMEQQVDLLSQSRVANRHLQLRSGGRSEIVTSGVYDELPLLVCEPGQIGGQTYSKAQAQFTIRTSNQRDGRVGLELTPEIHFGENRQRWAAEPGIFRLEAGQSRRGFDKMAIAATLAPGQMLVMTSLANRPGSLGHYFFTDNQSGSLEQKLLVIRLAQTQHDNVVQPPKTLNVDVTLPPGS